MNHLLTLVTFFPLLALVVALLVPGGKKGLFKYIALAGVGGQMVLSCLLLGAYKLGEGFRGVNLQGEFQLVEKYDWIRFKVGEWGVFSADYFLGVDGINILLVVLSAFVLLVGVISSWNIKKNEKAYFALYLLLSTTVVGCFVSLDLLLFFIFFEFMLLPMYFLIGIWGGDRREYAAIKFFLYTLFGSVFILIVMIGLYNSVIDPLETAKMMGFAGADAVSKVQELLAQGLVPKDKLVHTFNMVAMMDKANYLPDSILGFSKDSAMIFGHSARGLAFLAMFIGFGIKLPIVPFHTWLPDAHVEAPTPISVVLAGILLKIGGYGMIRLVYGIFPDAGTQYVWIVSLVAMITIVYGGYLALGMSDLKKLIAYSSVSHMGFVILGIASYSAEGVSGAIYQMVSHGIISPMLFLAAGVIYDRTHDRQIDSFRGLAEKMPAYTAMVTVAFFASLGLPGFSGFISEVFVFLGAFGAEELVPRWMVLISLLGLLLGAGYYLWTLQRMFFGPYWIKREAWTNGLSDLTGREYLMLVPLGLLALVMGIFPSLVLDYINPAVNQFVALLR